MGAGSLPSRFSCIGYWCRAVRLLLRVRRSTSPATRPPATGLSDTITVTISYTDSDLGPAIESSLQLYRLEGSSWITQGITSTLNTAGNLLTALVDRLGRFAVLAETNRVYMPVTFKTIAGGW